MVLDTHGREAITSTTLNHRAARVMPTGATSQHSHKSAAFWTSLWFKPSAAVKTLFSPPLE
jgi:hypothetical protein